MSFKFIKSSHFHYKPPRHPKKNRKQQLKWEKCQAFIVNKSPIRMLIITLCLYLLYHIQLFSVVIMRLVVLRIMHEIFFIAIWKAFNKWVNIKNEELRFVVLTTKKRAKRRIKSRLKRMPKKKWRLHQVNKTISFYKPFIGGVCDCLRV